MKFANNAESTLDGGIGSGATSFSVASGHGARFPTLAAGEYFYVRLGSDANNEVVKVTARSTDTLTCEATSSAWNDTTPVILTINKEILDELKQTNIDVASYAADQTLTDTECFGYVIYVTAAATITLPAVAEGMHVTIITIGDVEVSIDPYASDKIWLDGVALDDGDKITNDSSGGDLAVLIYYSADGWHASTNGWTDGG
jgi:hypothetical protein